MHQTTLRFSADLWRGIERHAGAAGMSAAQYVREAVLARVVYDGASAGEAPFTHPAAPVELPPAEAPAELTSADVHLMGSDPRGAHSEAELAGRQRGGESAAVWQQSRQARQRAQELRADAERVREGPPRPE
jgi:hypothetical protein